MEEYQRETTRIIGNFFGDRLSFPECVASLDAALGALIPRLHNDQLRALRSVLLANNDVVMKEMERRGPPV